MGRTHLLGRRFREFTYNMTTEWVEEFASITGEPLQYIEENGRRAPLVPESACGVTTLAICQQRWFDLAEALESSWTEGTLMMGEQSYQWIKPLKADYPYRVTNEVVRVEEKQGKRGPFSLITFETCFLEEDGTVAYKGSTSFVVFD